MSSLARSVADYVNEVYVCTSGGYIHWILYETAASKEEITSITMDWTAET